MAGSGQGRLAAVTGATGFIGGHLLPVLAARGWRLRILARSMPRLGGGAAVEVVQGDLADPQALAALVRGADAVLHLAGAVKASPPAGFHAANVAGTEAPARAWRAEAPGARFLLLSSMAARAPHLSPYAASKRAAEERLADIAAGGDWRILRPAAVYGPGDRETLRIFRAAAGPVQPMLNGPQARVTMVHAADLAAAILAVLEEGAPGTRREVTDGRPEGYGWDEIAREAAKALGRPARPLRVPVGVVRIAGVLGDVAARLGGGAEMLTRAKAREILHPDWSSAPENRLPAKLWRPRIGIAEGFAETVAWYRARGLLPG